MRIYRGDATYPSRTTVSTLVSKTSYEGSNPSSGANLTTTIAEDKWSIVIQNPGYIDRSLAKPEEVRDTHGL